MWWGWLQDSVNIAKTSELDVILCGKICPLQLNKVVIKKKALYEVNIHDKHFLKLKCSHKLCLWAAGLHRLFAFISYLPLKSYKDDRLGAMRVSPGGALVQWEGQTEAHPQSGRCWNGQRGRGEAGLRGRCTHLS